MREQCILFVITYLQYTKPLSLLLGLFQRGLAAFLEERRSQVYG